MGIMRMETLELPLGEAAHTGGRIALGTHAVVLPGFARPQAAALFGAMTRVAAAAPFRQMLTPGGRAMSVANTNCGQAGWVSDRTGYRYDPLDRETGRSWPPMPDLFRDLAVKAAGIARFKGFMPDACLINRYEPGARLSLHQDRNERDFGQPVVTVSLGLSAIFLWGGLQRSDRPARVPLAHGDVVVWGGPDRLVYHGVKELPDGHHALTGRARYSLTFRRAL
jgi:DNA oxidative demethylase